MRVEINEDLLRQVRAIAKDRGLTEEELIEAAIAPATLSLCESHTRGSIVRSNRPVSASSRCRTAL